jgi:hypothetical protein
MEEEAWPHAILSAALALSHGQKFQVGYEMLAEVQRDLTPEEAAANAGSPFPKTPRATEPHRRQGSDEPFHLGENG